MKLYKCEKCGNVICLMEGDASHIRCCGEEMTELVPNSIDASSEKHVPYVKIDGDKIYISIGEVEHPMEEDHFIEWVAVVSDLGLSLFKFVPGDEPSIALPYRKGSTVYSYCNKHGLWKKETE